MVSERERMSFECDAADAPRMTSDREPNTSAMPQTHRMTARAIERLRSFGLQISSPRPMARHYRTWNSTTNNVCVRVRTLVRMTLRVALRHSPAHSRADTVSGVELCKIMPSSGSQSSSHAARSSDRNRVGIAGFPALTHAVSAEVDIFCVIFIVQPRCEQPHNMHLRLTPVLRQVLDGRMATVTFRDEPHKF